MSGVLEDISVVVLEEIHLLFVKGSRGQEKGIPRIFGATHISNFDWGQISKGEHQIQKHSSDEAFTSLMAPPLPYDLPVIHSRRISNDDRRLQLGGAIILEERREPSN